MPARRLPWLKLWPEAMRHEKVALLSDSAFRTWICVLTASAEQPIRGRFASLQHAAIVTGRPTSDLQRLLDGGLLDYAEGALWVHDWAQWQDKYPSDFAVAEHSANGRATLREGSANAPNTLPPDTEEEERVKKKEQRGETSSPLPPPPQAGEGARKGRTKHSADIPRDYAGALCPAGCGTTHGGPTAEQELRARWLTRPADDGASWADFAALHGRRDLAGSEVPTGG